MTETNTLFMGQDKGEYGDTRPVNEISLGGISYSVRFELIYVFRLHTELGVELSEIFKRFRLDLPSGTFPSASCSACSIEAF